MYKDAEIDYMAVMSSIDTINEIRNDSWPTKELTLEDNQIDLGWHQREFEFHQSFSYIVWTKDLSEYLGCVYFYRTELPWIKAPDGADVDISVWVTKKTYDNGLYPIIFNCLRSWVENGWPFKTPYYSNKKIPD